MEPKIIFMNLFTGYPGPITNMIPKIIFNMLQFEKKRNKYISVSACNFKFVLTSIIYLVYLTIPEFRVSMK